MPTDHGEARAWKLGPGAAALVHVRRNRYVVLTDTEGSSQVRFAVFNADEPTERLSLSHTRIGQSHLLLSPTSSLLSNHRRVMARVCEDDVRAHDIVISSSCELEIGTRLRADLESYGIPHWSVPDPIALFTPVAYDAGGAVERLPSASFSGARWVLLSRMNLLCITNVVQGGVTVSVQARMEGMI